MKTWSDIEAAARSEPLLQMAIDAVASGRCTREEALIIVTLNLIEYKNKVTDLALSHSDRVSRSLWYKTPC